MDLLNRRNKIGLLVILLCAFLLAGLFAYHYWMPKDAVTQRAEMFAHLPEDPNLVFFLDFEEFRSSIFLRQLLSLVPQTQVEKDYADFMQATGFRYEEDLDRVAVAMVRDGNRSSMLAIADGRFDRKKIEDYVARSGKRIGNGTAAIFVLPTKNSERVSYFRFLTNARIAWTDDPSFAEMIGNNAPRHRVDDEWMEHFSRLAGTPLFVVMRQDAALAEAMTQMQSGFRSPQLAALLAQLQWISIGGKPDGSSLRVVAEGESTGETTATQLRDFLQGLLVLAQAGLDGPVNRKALAPEVRRAYLDVLKSAQVDKTDRGASKSVRLIFEITPEFLQAAQSTSQPARNATTP